MIVETETYAVHRLTAQSSPPSSARRSSTVARAAWPAGTSQTPTTGNEHLPATASAATTTAAGASLCRAPGGPGYQPTFTKSSGSVACQTLADRPLQQERIGCRI